MPLGRSGGVQDSNSSSMGFRPTKPLSPKSRNFPAAPPTERPKRKLSPTLKSSSRNGSKPPKNSAALSPPPAAASPSLKSCKCLEVSEKGQLPVCPRSPKEAEHYNLDM